jgi:thiol:disulfide interchange protein DsbC
MRTAQSDLEGSMMILVRILWIVALSASASAGYCADQPVQAPDPRIELAKKIPGTTPDELHTTPIAGMYELMHGTDIAYVTSDGKYAISGDLYDLGRNDNLTEVRRRDIRMKLLASVPESDMLIFSPRDPKYTVTVFTDVDCAYCRKLHSQIAEYNRLGVRVRYMFFPRSGPNTDSWTKAEQVWCSTNRNEALTRAKLGEELKSPKSCANSPVGRDYAMGQKFDIRGTPAIVMNNGEMLGGYMAPMQLVQHLQSK